MEIIIPLTLVVCGLGGWLLALSMLSSKSGWRALARQYRAGPKNGTAAGGARFQYATISVGRLFFRSRANVSVTAAGVELALLPYLRPFHPPLYFPWKDLERRGGHTDQVVFGVGTPALGEIRIPMAAVEAGKR